MVRFLPIQIETLNRKNLIVGQSGGPTAVINSSLYGVVSEGLLQDSIGHVYGMVNGIEGFLAGRVLDFQEVFKGNDLENDLDFYPVMEEELVLIAPCGHPLAEKQSVDLRDTIQYPYIAFAKNSGLRPVINHLFEQIQCRPSVAYEGEEDSSVAGLTAAGFGIAIIPNIPLLQTMDLEILPISSPKIRRYIYLVTKKNKYLAPAAKDFVDFVKKNYSVL